MDDAETTITNDYQFGPFRLYCRECQLLRDGDTVHLQPKSFELLLYLLDHAGRLVEKRELMDVLWAGSVVTESSLTQCIYQLRSALEHGGDSSVSIETVPTRGFRLRGPVQTLKPMVAAVHEESFSRPTARTVSLLIAVLLVVAAGGVIIDRVIREPASLPEPAARETLAAERISIAVLPFVNMSSDPEQEYLSDGLSEELLNLLARIQDLKVIARTSSFYYKGKDIRIEDVAQDLGVTHVLEGSVRRAGDQVRITAQLIDTTDSSSLWSETYDRTLDDMFTLQNEIATAVVNALEVTLLGEMGEVVTTGALSRNTEAHQLYLQGRFFWNRRSSGDVERTKDYYQRALELDPNIAGAWAGLSGIYFSLFWQGGPGAEEARGKAHEAAERAIALDPTLPEAQVRMARIHLVAGELEATAAWRQRALELGPNNALVLTSTAGQLARQNRLDDAIELYRRAASVDPLSSVIWGNMGYLLTLAGRYEEAEVAQRTALELNLDGDREYDLGVIKLLQGLPDEALAFMQQLPDSSLKLSGLAMAYFDLGRENESDATLAELINRYGSQSPMGVVEAYAWRGANDEAFAWLDKTVDQLGLWRVRDLIGGSPLLKRLYGDSRWDRLLAATDANNIH